jgi:hypothetical protein
MVVMGMVRGGSLLCRMEEFLTPKAAPLFEKHQGGSRGRETEIHEELFGSVEIVIDVTRGGRRGGGRGGG